MPRRPNAPIRLLLLVFALPAISALVLSGCSPETSSRSNPPVADGPLDATAMQEAVAVALADPDTLDRVDAITKLMRRVDEHNVLGAMAAYESAVNGLDREEVRLFANAWARIDPEQAMDRFTHWRAPGFGQRAVAEVAFYWTRHGGGEAARRYAIESLGVEVTERETVRNVILDSIAAGFAAAGDHDSLTRMLEQFPADQTRKWIITQAMIEFYRRGAPAMRAWVDSIPWDAKNDLKRDALESAIASLCHMDGPAAASWYESVEPRLDKGAYLEQIGESWSAYQPEAAIEWLLARPSSEARRLGLRAAAYRFLKADGPKASAWIEKRIDDPAVKAAMLFPLTQYMISVDLRAALPLAEKIDSPGEQLSTLKQILVRWSREDYAAVERYMAEKHVAKEVEDAVRGMRAIRQQQEQRADPSVPQG